MLISVKSNNTLAGIWQRLMKHIKVFINNDYQLKYAVLQLIQFVIFIVVEFFVHL